MVRTVKFSNFVGGHFITPTANFCDHQMGLFDNMLARANTSTISPLGGIGGVGRSQVRLGIGAATGGFEVGGDTRQYNVQNYHVLNIYQKNSNTYSLLYFFIFWSCFMPKTGLIWHFFKDLYLVKFCDKIKFKNFRKSPRKHQQGDILQNSYSD
jgi:hypothetical protein